MKLYTKTICPKCMLIKMNLIELGIYEKFDVISIDENEQAKKMLKNRGILSVPVIEMDGELIYDFTQLNEKIQMMSV